MIFITNSNLNIHSAFLLPYQNENDKVLLSIIRKILVRPAFNCWKENGKPGCVYAQYKKNYTNLSFCNFLKKEIIQLIMYFLTQNPVCEC
jgi:hypothetical protein